MGELKYLKKLKNLEKKVKTDGITKYDSNYILIVCKNEMEILFLKIRNFNN